MKNLKQIVLVIALIISSSVGLKAQSLDGIIEKDPIKRAQARTKMMSEKLAFSDEQYQKVLVLNKELALQLQPLIFNDGDIWVRAQKAVPLLQKHRKEIENALTSEQQKKLVSLQSEMRSKFRKLITVILNKD